MQLSPDVFGPVTTALALVLALVLVAAGVARHLRPKIARLKPGGGSSRLRLEATLSLDQTRRAQILRCDGRDLLLVTGPGADLFIGWLDPRNTSAVIQEGTGS